MGGCLCRSNHLAPYTLHSSIQTKRMRHVASLHRSAKAAYSLPRNTNSWVQRNQGGLIPPMFVLIVESTHTFRAKNTKHSIDWVFDIHAVILPQAQQTKENGLQNKIYAHHIACVVRYIVLSQRQHCCLNTIINSTYLHPPPLYSQSENPPIQNQQLPIETRRAYGQYDTCPAICYLASLKPPTTLHGAAHSAPVWRARALVWEAKHQGRLEETWKKTRKKHKGYSQSSGRWKREKERTLSKAAYRTAPNKPISRNGNGSPHRKKWRVQAVLVLGDTPLNALVSHHDCAAFRPAHSPIAAISSNEGRIAIQARLSGTTSATKNSLLGTLYFRRSRNANSKTTNSSTL